MKNDKFFGFLLWFTAIFIAGCAAFFSVRGIGLLFAGSFIPVVIMASSLEVGKLMTASFLYRAWKKITFWLKTYLTIATLSLIGITSMGIYGFLSDAFSKTSARIAFYEENIKQLEQQNTLSKEQISKIENSASMVDTKAEDAINNFQKIYDDYLADQRKRQDALNGRLKELDSALAELEAGSGGLFSNKKTKIEKLKVEQKEERDVVRSQLNEIDKNIDEEYKRFLSKVEQYRETSNKVNTQPDIEGFYSQINKNNKTILSFKESIKNTDIGSFKFIASAFDIPLEQVVKWFIIVIVFVFDPLAVSLVIAYHVYTGKKQLISTENPKKKLNKEAKAIPAEKAKESLEVEAISVEKAKGEPEAEAIPPKEVKEEVQVETVSVEEVKEELEIKNEEGSKNINESTVFIGKASPGKHYTGDMAR